MKKAILIISLPLFLGMYSCHGGNGSASEDEESGTVRPGEVKVTRAQFDASGMKVGEPSSMIFSDEVSANGILSSSLEGRAKINTLISGRVRAIHHTVGDRVQKGEALFQIESHEIILLQQEYAEVFQQLKQLKANYERKKTLSEEKVIAEKDFFQTESEYMTMMARAEGLKARLKMIYIDPAGVEQGKILSVLHVRSPIQGIVTRQELVLGQFVEPQVTLMEVVDTRELQITLKVFEKDLAGLEVGQVVHFSVPGQEDRIYEATLSHVGASIDMDTKTIECIARVKSEDRGAFVNNLFVETRIVTHRRESLAVPESALIKESGRDYLWIRANDSGDYILFRKVPVETGATRNGFTEIQGEDLKDVLLEGAYNLWSEE